MSDIARNGENKKPMTSLNVPTKQCCGPETGNEEKLRVLCIHGYRQNGEVFRQKTGSFRKMVHKWVQFTYCTAPHKVLLVDDPLALEDPSIADSKDVEQYGWFFNRDDKTFRGIRKGGPAIGFEEAVKMIEDIFEREGPFDGILGFSQGACFVGLLCDLQHRGLTKHINFKFAVMASGFKSGALPHLKYYSDRINLPTMHIFGETDNIIPTEMSEALSHCFEDPIIVRHPGGHYFPANSQQKSDYQRFFKLCYLQKQQRKDDENIKN